jgi:PhzF family phenazine biosynthesis protein
VLALGERAIACYINLTMGLPLYIIDAFTDQPFSGNPAAVCMLDMAHDDVWMQSVAAEMNLSETAFLLREGGGYRLRWFTPAVEVELCGHATLASSHFLWQTGYLGVQEAAIFNTKSGVLTAQRSEDWIEMDFPAEPVEQRDIPEKLTRALGASAVFAGQNRFDWLVEVADEAMVKGLTPDMDLLREVPTRGVIVTARSNSPEYDFVSRFFAPRCGIVEDPVTGSAHCALGPYWRERVGKESLIGRQVSPRGGIVRVRTAGQRVKLGGMAVTVLRAELLIERLAVARRTT